ncbi:MAG: hypothetical protein GY832_30240, partial [Chloroflexi bacterium]|nr:hypothetical protein [Chloroflexota bacterium]
LESSVYIGAKLTNIFSSNFFCYHIAIMLPRCNFVKVQLTLNFVQTPNISSETPITPTVTRVYTQIVLVASSSISLTAAPDGGWDFDGWSGDVVSTSNPLSLTMAANTVLTATFSSGQPHYLLTVTTDGSGSGRVTSVPAGIDCGIDCTAFYLETTVVTLTAVADTGSTFAGWGGACTGSGACVVTMNTAQDVTATFDLLTYTLTITTTGDGTGTVDLDPLGGVYNHNTGVTLTATPAPGSYFGGWTGDLLSANNPETLVMDEDKAVTATFSTTPPVTYTLTVHTVGSGTVDPAGGTYISGTVLILIATPDVGWQFEGWSGDVVSTSNPFSITMTGDVTVTATFVSDGYEIYLPLVLRNY